jgi:hypothetical protein
MIFSEWCEADSRFLKRTQYHISLVKKYGMKIINKTGSEFSEGISLLIDHDKSKFFQPERNGYVLVNHHYWCQKEGINFKPTPEQKKMMGEATLHHIVTNRHHPEFHDPNNEKMTDDNPVGVDFTKSVIATSMDKFSIFEMVSDWLAMSEELNNSPFEWASKVIGKKFIFDTNQVNLILKLIELGWK